MHTNSAPNSVPISSDLLIDHSISFADSKLSESSAQSSSDQAISDGYAREWVIPDGQGGFAMGTASGVPMRRYHGLLCSAIKPPVCRMMMLNAMDECLVIPNGGSGGEGGGDLEGEDLEIRLTAFQFMSQDPPIQNPYLTKFTLGISTCQWDYEIQTNLGLIRLSKTLTIADRSNACALEYRIETPFEHSDDFADQITLELRPLISMRDFHELNAPGSLIIDEFTVDTQDDSQVTISRYQTDGLLILQSTNDTASVDWESSPAIWRNLQYDHETRRQQDDSEDLYCPGMFCAPISGDSTTVRIEARVQSALNQDSSIDWERIQSQKSNRVLNSAEHALSAAGNPQDPLVRDAIVKLAQAADGFVVDRMMGDEQSTSIIAGYPWFSDWGRDTMIAIPGLLLSTGRFDEAHATLSTFAKAIKHGLIPNRFDDNDEEAHYNTVDASLWFVHACYQWSQASKRSLDEPLISACDQILGAYIAGTINSIGLDESDGLISAGDISTQLTWMDALRDGIAFTPRFGKAIEINALWINALESRLRMCDSSPMDYASYALRARESLLQHLAHGPSNGLVDCMSRVDAVRTSSVVKSQELRPNQIFALSLPFVGLPHATQSRSLSAVTDALLTPIGLRTLDPESINYCPKYAGSMADRDQAYHNGTAWPWLLGPYCEALMRVEQMSSSSKQRAQAIMLRLVSKMDMDAIGQLYEIYDAEPTDGFHQPQGCMAQAWSVSEALRVLILTSSISNS